MTARNVALGRAVLARPEIPTGDAGAEARLYRSLGGVMIRPLAPFAAKRMARRTAFIDAAVLDALAGGVHQIVIIAAGYDGRALRFATPGVRWWEVDHPATQADKRRRLEDVGAAPPDTAFVACNLITDDLGSLLTAAGYEAGTPTLFTIEGLFGYLELPVTTRLLENARMLGGPESSLAVAFPTRDRSGVKERVRTQLLSVIGEPWKTHLTVAESEQLLADTGWRIVERATGVEGRGLLVRAVPT